MYLLETLAVVGVHNTRNLKKFVASLLVPLDEHCLGVVTTFNLTRSVCFCDNFFVCGVWTFTECHT